MAIPSITFGGIGRSRGGGGSGVLAPAPATSWSAAYGGVPQVPSPLATAAGAITGNIGNLSNLYRLAGGVNTFNQDQLETNMAASVPDYEALTSKSSANTGAALRGELPQDVINQILQQAAERGITTGTVGSDNSNAAYLRALGLTSLDQTRKGEEMLTGAMSRAPKAPLVDIPSMFVTPDQNQDAQMAANLYASAPVPSAAGSLALGAARSGINAGAGAGANWATGPMSAPVRNPASFGTGAWSNRPEPSYYVDQSMVGHATGPFPPSQSEIYSNWQNWAQGIPTGSGKADWFYDPASGGFWDLVTGDFSQTGPGDNTSGTTYMGSGEDYYE